jgi:hypothetical protein
MWNMLIAVTCVRSAALKLSKQIYVTYFSLHDETWNNVEEFNLYNTEKKNIYSAKKKFLDLCLAHKL